MVDERQFEQGISVIVPAYKSEKYIINLLNSIENQTLDNELFEVLVIINGERDETESIIKDFQIKHPDINIRLFESEKGASAARNVGLDNLKREYTIFIDADDYISSNYLEEIYAHSASNRMVLGYFLDQNYETGEISKTYFSNELLKNQGFVKDKMKIRSAVVITTNKSIPSKISTQIRFSEDIYHSVDVDYFANLLSKFEFEYYVIPSSEEVVYYRVKVPDSLSRQDVSYEYNVLGKLEVIKKVDGHWNNIEKRKNMDFLDFCINRGLISYINKYLEMYPEDYLRVLNELNSANLSNFNGIPLTNNIIENNKSLIGCQISNHEFKKLKKTNTRLRKENRKLKKTNKKIINSNSWKLTKPLRKINNSLKK